MINQQSNNKVRVIMRLFCGLPIKLICIFLGVCVGWGMHSAFLYLYVQTQNNLLKQNLLQQVDVIREFAKTTEDPTIFFQANQFARFENVVSTPFFSIVNSNSNDIYMITHTYDGYVIVSEMNEQKEDMSFVITRTYIFQENGIRVVCSFTRDAVNKKLFQCYYSFNGSITYIDTNGDGIWDISPVNTDKLNVGSELPVKHQPNHSPISPSKSESNSEK
ncbi:hypothetical protein FACS1894170_10060 [Planctomycetales bacterium]|nr:hypothetical protein FACS1894170_10060 [Planctomycetales bacterium]